MKALRLTSGLLAVLILLAAGCSRKSNAIIVQLDWVAEPEHGGFYQALAKGYFKQAGLDVTIIPGGPNGNVMQKIAAGQADIGQSDSTNAILAIAQRSGVSQQFTATASLSTNTVVQVLAAMVVSGAFAISAYAGPRTGIYSTLTGGLGWMAYLGGIRVSLGPAFASAFAALVVGCLAQLVASRLQVPALALTTAGIVPLLPGLVVYQGLFEIVRSTPGAGLSTGLTTLLGAAGIGMGLAAGVSMGTFLARPLRSGLDRGQRRALRRAVGDARE